ncbi:malto-oligosyltrehalose synthase [candidate division KSB1 bacterium]|nr:malto-oligosyltrehalose synthase [candidate division KSB1 bacterium]
MSYSPRASYRIQFNKDFTFRDAKKIIEYLSELGISHLYASPVFKAREGSGHGYDVVDPNQLNPELGADKDFDLLQASLQKAGMGWIQDVVPNHMAFDKHNTMLMDVLENGPDSEYFDYFDFEWDHHYNNLRGKILAPFLGDFYAECLERQEIQLSYGKEGLSVAYYEHRFPVRLESYYRVFSHDLMRLQKTLKSTDPDYLKLLGIFYAIKNLSPSQAGEEREHQIQFVKTLLWELYQSSIPIKEFFDANITRFNGDKGDPSSFDLLDELLSEQFYRLAFWKVGTEEINYRRFFNINELISVRMHDDKVFRHLHKMIASMIENGLFHGLRIDHIDGLLDPTQYLQRLRQAFPDLYLLVEKILDFEKVPEFWPIQGTSGYEFLNALNGLFIKRENEQPIKKIYHKIIQTDIHFDRLVHDKKRLIVGKHMAGDIDNLAHLLARISNQTRYGSDFTLYGLRRALVEVAAWFPVYRTYISDREFRETDKKIILDTVEKSKKELPDFDHEFDFIRDVLLLDAPSSTGEQDKQLWLTFVHRFQQITGPLMAKGFEDTVLYLYHKLISLNEVGGNPEKFGTSRIEFHYFNKSRAATWPHAMSTTATHDTKRGEDVRARLNVISEVPDEWERHVRHWMKNNRKLKTKDSHGALVPDRNDEYFLYQTLLGTLPVHEKIDPIYIDRIKNYLLKAVREAKVHSAWLDPDIEYENGFISFLEKLLTGSKDNRFLDDFIPLAEKIAFYGRWNSISQTVLKMTCPGVPDFYQGTELFDFSLVDPDNRRPVDFAIRSRMLAKIKQHEKKPSAEWLNELMQDEIGAAKMFVIRQCLQVREQHKELFYSGTYIPLEVGGLNKNHIVAFARKWQEQWALVIVPRFFTALIEPQEYPTGPELWQDTHIILSGKQEWVDNLSKRPVKTDSVLHISEIFDRFPVAILTGEEENGSSR